MEDRFSPLVNRGENAVGCRSICEATGTEAFAKICIADAVRVEALGIPDSLGNPVEGERDSGLKPNTIPL